jgi:hypothetical protein
VAIWLRDNPLSQYIRREVFLDVSFTAASFHTLDSISGESQTFALAAVTDGFQPNAGARLDEVLASKLPVAPLLPPTALEQADRKRVDPLCALKSRPRGKLGWPFAIFDDCPKFQTGCPKADNRTGHRSQKAGELNSFQLQGVHHGRIKQQVPPRTVE